MVRLNGVLCEYRERHAKTQEELRTLHASLGTRWAKIFKESSDLSGMRNYREKQLVDHKTYRQERDARLAHGEKVKPIKTICPDDAMVVLPKEIQNFSKKISEKEAALDEIEKVRGHLETMIEGDEGG